MKRAIRSTHILLWVICLTGALVTYLFNAPSILAHLPQSFWHYLVLTYDAKNAEEIADVEMLVAFALSFLAAVLLTFVGMRVLQMVRRKRTEGCRTNVHE